MEQMALTLPDPPKRRRRRTATPATDGPKVRSDGMPLNWPFPDRMMQQYQTRHPPGEPPQSNE
jgi:hypothetical protein